MDSGASRRLSSSPGAAKGLSGLIFRVWSPIRVWPSCFSGSVRIAFFKLCTCGFEEVGPRHGSPAGGWPHRDPGPTAVFAVRTATAFALQDSRPAAGRVVPPGSEQHWNRRSLLLPGCGRLSRGESEINTDTLLVAPQPAVLRRARALLYSCRLRAIESLRVAFHLSSHDG